jgi:hypothetical protein
MKQCMNDLTNNLDKVEHSVHKHNRAKRFAKRAKKGAELDPIPASVRQGVMTKDLYAVECSLHKAAGLPPPRLPKELGGKTQREERRALAAGAQPAAEEVAVAVDHRFGLIQFSDLVCSIKARRAVKA